MQDIHLHRAVIEKKDFRQQRLEKGSYESCTFKDCSFSGGDLSGSKFTDCSFNRCDLSLVKLTGTFMQDIIFTGCKMLGIRFDQCKPFGLSFAFEGCQLNNASFFQTKTRRTRFSNCTICEADFVSCELIEAVFDNCDLARSVFEDANLEKADFRSAYNYIIDPEKNRIKKAKFSINGTPGLLTGHDIEIEM